MSAGGQTEGKLERHSGLPAEVSSLVGRGPQIAAVLEGLRATRVLARWWVATGRYSEASQFLTAATQLLPSCATSSTTNRRPRARYFRRCSKFLR